MLVKGGKPEANLGRAVQMIHDAGGQDCQFIVLPECLDLGWMHPSAHDLAQPIPGPHTARLSEAAQSAGIYVVAGLTERSRDDLYNAAVLISPEGEILLKHRKINEVTTAPKLYSIGDSLGVAKTPLGTVAINICADNFPNSLALAHSLARMGAQILLSPTAWAVDADHDNEKTPYGGEWKHSYTTLARLYDMPVVGVSNVGWIDAGPCEGKKCIGSSLAVDSGGDILLEGPHGEDAESLMVVEVEIKPAVAAGNATAAMLKTKGYEGI